MLSMLTRRFHPSLQSDMCVSPCHFYFPCGRAHVHLHIARIMVSLLDGSEAQERDLPFVYGFGLVSQRSQTQLQFEQIGDTTGCCDFGTTGVLMYVSAGKTVGSVCKYDNFWDEMLIVDQRQSSQILCVCWVVKQVLMVVVVMNNINS